MEDRDICLNVGCRQECRNCDEMCDTNCSDYESQQTRILELESIKTQSGGGF